MFTMGFSEDVDTSSVQVLGMYLEIFDNKIIRHFSGFSLLYGSFHPQGGRSARVTDSCKEQWVHEWQEEQ